MKSTVIAGITASLLALAAFSGSAQAQCVWTGAFFACPPVVSIAPRYVAVYPPPNPGYGRYGWDWWGPEKNGTQAGIGTGD
jgi:hypothetical protein